MFSVSVGSLSTKSHFMLTIFFNTEVKFCSNSGILTGDTDCSGELFEAGIGWGVLLHVLSKVGEKCNWKNMVEKYPISLLMVNELKYGRHYFIHRLFNSIHLLGHLVVLDLLEQCHALGNSKRDSKVNKELYFEVWLLG